MGIVTDVVLPIALAFIMLALGLGLTFDDFVRVARRPRDFAVGAMSQIIVLPAVAFLLASIWPMAPELALGLMIIAAAPGGVTSNLLTAFARGDVALSISLTAVISLLSVITGRLWSSSPMAISSASMRCRTSRSPTRRSAFS